LLHGGQAFLYVLAGFVEFVDPLAEGAQSVTLTLLSQDGPP
jgi:hypothetical protein